jgi:hypothetical protein
MNGRRVILYGNSVILGTLGASLIHHADLDIIPLSPPLPGAEVLATLKPDVILFDITAARPKAVFTLLETCPNLLLIGVSPETHQVQLWTSGQERAGTMLDLVKLISSKPWG